MANFTPKLAFQLIYTMNFFKNDSRSNRGRLLNLQTDHDRWRSSRWCPCYPTKLADLQLSPVMVVPLPACLSSWLHQQRWGTGGVVTLRKSPADHAPSLSESPRSAHSFGHIHEQDFLYFRYLLRYLPWRFCITVWPTVQCTLHMHLKIISLQQFALF